MNKKAKIGLGVMGVLLLALVGGLYYSQQVEAPKNNEKVETSSVSERETSTGETSVNAEMSEEQKKQENKELTEKAKKEKEEKEKAEAEKKAKEEEEKRFSREGAVIATTELIKELNVSPDGKMSLEDRMKEVSKETYDKNLIFTDKAWAKLRLTDFMSTDPRGTTLSAQSLLSVIHSIQETGNKEMTPAEIDYSGVVYFDKDMKIAYVPVDLYTNAPTNLSFEMMYKDGEWVLQPYSLIAQIAIRSMDTDTANKTPEGTTNNENKAE